MGEDPKILSKAEGKDLYAEGVGTGLELGKRFTWEERKKLIGKIKAQKKELRNLNRSIRLYRQMWVETFEQVKRWRVRAEALEEKLMAERRVPPRPPLPRRWWWRGGASGLPK